MRNIKTFCNFKKINLILTPIVLVVVFLMQFTQYVYANQDMKKVLFISSYSYDWSTIPLQIEGIESVLEDYAQISYEFMDTKKVNDKESLNMFYKSLKYKLDKSPPYDAVILGDDAALQFALEHKNDLFKNTPLVFEGINDIDKAIEAGKEPLITGVVEQISYKENIDMAIKLCPLATKIVAIVDDTITGVGEQKQFYANEKNYPQLKFSEINASKLSEEELCESISNLNERTIPFYLICGEDKHGNLYSSSKVEAIFSTYAKVPVFRMVQAGIGNGILGGNIVSHKEEGAIAAKMVLDILNGTSPQTIGVVTESPNFYYFDYQTMKKFGISEKNLPSNSTIINRDISFFEKYSYIIVPFFTTGFFIFLLLSILVLSASLKDRNLLIEKINAKNNQLEMANRAKTDFLSRMSHDIRTPMNAIIGLSEIASSKADNPQAVMDSLDRINNSSKYLLAIINDILEMSRIESGKAMLSCKKFNLSEAVTSICDIIHSQALEKNICFDTEMNENLAQLYVGDEVKLKQIIMNLLSNALKFVDDGGKIHLSVKEMKTADQNNYLLIEVKDNGIGIEKSFIEKIFEPFEQADKGTARNQVGSGLGLSIVKCFVEMMDGEITVESEENKGTTFKVKVRLERCEDEESTKQNKIENDFTCLRGEKILLAEDNQINAEIAQDILQMKGMVVDIAYDGKEVVKVFNNSEAGYYMCILMDIRMPLMDGIEATKAIRSSAHICGKTIPIIALTANAFDEDIDIVKNAGMNGHISKPIEPNIMFNILKEIAMKKK